MPASLTPKGKKGAKGQAMHSTPTPTIKHLLTGDLTRQPKETDKYRQSLTIKNNINKARTLFSRLCPCPQTDPAWKLALLLSSQLHPGLLSPTEFWFKKLDPISLFPNHCKISRKLAQSASLSICDLTLEWSSRPLASPPQPVQEQRH